MIDYQKVFREIASEFNNAADCGEVASYIPELGKVNPGKSGIYLTTVQKHHYSFGGSTVINLLILNVVVI